VTAKDLEALSQNFLQSDKIYAIGNQYSYK